MRRYLDIDTVDAVWWEAAGAVLWSHGITEFQILD